MVNCFANTQTLPCFPSIFQYAHSFVKARLLKADIDLGRYHVESTTTLFNTVNITSTTAAKITGLSALDSSYHYFLLT